MSSMIRGRQPKPRTRGITMMIDPGLPTRLFTDVVESHGEHIDFVKLGWGTALVTSDLQRKTDVLRRAGVRWFLGGTLFEHHVWTGEFDDFVRLLRRLRATHVEVSNGTIPLGQQSKAEYVRRLSREFCVLSEVGYKDAARSASLTPADWVAAMTEDLHAGASLVIAETRESGRSGIAQPDGRLRPDVLAAVVAEVGPAAVLFEAPTKELQVELIRAVGPDVNLGNVAAADVLGVATLRLGLRADTLLQLASPQHASEAPVMRTAPAPVSVSAA